MSFFSLESKDYDQINSNNDDESDRQRSCGTGDVFLDSNNNNVLSTRPSNVGMRRVVGGKSTVATRKKQIVKDTVESDLANSGVEKIIALSDHNSLLTRQMKEMKQELVTLKRQCKIQDAQLSKSVHSDQQAPKLIQRLTMDVQNMTLQLRQKSTKCETLQKQLRQSETKLKHAQDRVAQLRESLNESTNAASLCTLKEHERVCQSLTQVTEQKQQLGHRLSVLEKNIKHREGLFKAKTKSLLIEVKEKDEQLEQLQTQLLEKTKLLDMCNIYALRMKPQLSMASSPFVTKKPVLARKPLSGSLLPPMLAKNSSQVSSSEEDSAKVERDETKSCGDVTVDSRAIKNEDADYEEAKAMLDLISSKVEERHQAAAVTVSDAMPMKNKPLQPGTGKRVNNPLSCLDSELEELNL